MTNQELLLQRILEAEKIAGSITKLARLAGINYMQISRVKSFLKGKGYENQKRCSFSVKTLQKLADAIGEDITFFTDENYIKKSDKYNSDKKYTAPQQEEPQLVQLIEDLKRTWYISSDYEKGVIFGRLTQIFIEHQKPTIKREPNERQNAQSA